MDDKQIIVLGMHRSGTSVLSKILSNLGVDMGDVNDTGGVSNIEGYYEDLELLKLDKEILKSLNASWDNPPSKTCIFSKKEYIIDKYKQFKENKTGIWGVKEPRLSLFCEYFSIGLSNPFYIYVKRSENEVYRSLLIRNNLSEDSARELKSIYDTAITNFLLNKNFLLLEYESLINQPLVALKSICEYIKLPYDELAVSHIKSKKDLLKAKKQKINQMAIKHLKLILKKPTRIFDRNYIFLCQKYLRFLFSKNQK